MLQNIVAGVESVSISINWEQTKPGEPIQEHEKTGNTDSCRIWLLCIFLLHTKPPVTIWRVFQMPLHWMSGTEKQLFFCGEQFCPLFVQAIIYACSFKGRRNSNLRLCEQELSLNCSNKAKSSLPQAKHVTSLNRSHKWQAASMKNISLQGSGQSA